MSKFSHSNLYNHLNLSLGLETIWGMDMRNQCKLIRIHSRIPPHTCYKERIEVNKSTTLSSRVIIRIKTTTQAWAWSKEKTTWSLNIEMEFLSKPRRSNLTNKLPPKTRRKRFQKFSTSPERNILEMYMELRLSHLDQSPVRKLIHKKKPWIIWRFSTF